MTPTTTALRFTACVWRTARATALRGLLLAPVLASAVGAQVVQGFVRTPDGRAIPLAHVFGVDAPESGALQVGTVTDSLGRFVLRLRDRRPAFLGVRRIGFRPDSLRALDWTAGDTLHRDIVLQTIPYSLPAVHVGSGICQSLDSLPHDSEVRQLWDAATATIAAREAFLNTYSYEVTATQRDRSWRPGSPPVVREYDTTYVLSPPRAPIAARLLSEPLATYRPPNFFRRKYSFQLRAASDREFLHPLFVQRFCIEDQLVAVADDAVEVRFSERRRKPGDIQVNGFMSFRPDVPGPWRVAFVYVLRGAVIARIEQTYGLFGVDGTYFPFETGSSVELLERRLSSGNSTGTSHERTHASYAKFSRVER